jgi:hypothetical protein
MWSDDEIRFKSPLKELFLPGDLNAVSKVFSISPETLQNFPHQFTEAALVVTPIRRSAKVWAALVEMRFESLPTSAISVFHPISPPIGADPIP